MGEYIGLFFFIHFMKIMSVTAFAKPCTASLQTVSDVAGCPTNDISYKIAALIKNCSSIENSCDSFEYHCVLREDLKTAIEVCAPSLYIVGHSCTMFSNRLQSILRVDEMTCGNEKLGCPFSYNSTYAYKYPQCFKRHRDRECQGEEPSCKHSVNGGWTQFFFAWKPCSVTCGGGIQSGQERRICTNPFPSSDGKPCEGSSYGRRASRFCNTHPCPVNGNWSEFGPYSKWGRCSVTCGIGIKSRSKTRICNNPKPQNGGKNCIGTNLITDTKGCIMSPCPVDGSWSEFVPYGDWSQCSVSCGSGTQTRVRFRTCSQPAPLYGGKPCEGPSTMTESKQCRRQVCPVLGGWSLYGPLSEWTTCTTSCGKGFQHRTRHRICNNPEPQHGGKDCVGLGIFKEERMCNIKSCAVHRDWSEWNNCPVSCGGGVQQSVRTRACNETKQGRNNCKESNETKEQRCNIQTCPVDGHWSLFIPLGDWSQCSSSCNNGTKTRVRIRTCSEPVPLYGGKPCVGQSMSTDTITCNTQPCSGKEDPKQKTIIIIALVSSILILLGGLLIFFYCRYKRIPKTESTPQRQPEVYEEIQSMDIVNNIYVPSYAEYIHNPRFLNRPNPGTALPFPSLFVNIQRTESTLTSNTNDCRLSEIVGHRKSNEMNEETAVGVKHNFKLSEVDESKMAICPRNESGSTDKEEYFDVANSITEDCPVDGYEKPMLKSRNSYITVLPDESKKPEETATKDQQDYLECCHDIDESVKN